MVRYASAISGKKQFNADLAISALLEPHRAAQLIESHAHHRANPELKEVVDALLARTWKAIRPKESYHAAIAQAVQSLAVRRLMDLAANSTAAPQVRVVATEALRELQTWLKSPAAVSIGAAASLHNAGEYRTLSGSS
jgi:hypothetical protein